MNSHYNDDNRNADDNNADIPAHHPFHRQQHHAHHQHHPSTATAATVASSPSPTIALSPLAAPSSVSSSFHHPGAAYHHLPLPSSTASNTRHPQGLHPTHANSTLAHAYNSNDPRHQLPPPQPQNMGPGHLHLPPPGPPSSSLHHLHRGSYGGNGFRLPAVSAIQIPATPPTHALQSLASASPTSATTMTSPVMHTPASARPPVVIEASPPPVYAHPYAQGYAPQSYGHPPPSSASTYTPYTYAPPPNNGGNNGGNGNASSSSFRAPGGGPIQVLASPVLSMPPMQSSSSSSSNVVVPLGAAQTQFSATAGAMSSPALNAAPPTSHSRIPFPSSNARDRDWDRDRERERNTRLSTSVSLTESSSIATSQSQSQAPIPAPGPGAPSTSSTTRDRNSRRHSTASIGKPVTFDTGPFAGRRVRAEIVEVQKADLGRKCADPPSASNSSSAHPPPSASGNAGGGRTGEPGEPRSVRKDRRPLDPPPVVSLQFYEVADDGTEHPISAEDVEIGGLICQVDLFKVTIPPSAAELAGMPALNPTSLSSASASSSLHHALPPPPPFPQVQPHGYYHNNPTIQPLVVPGPSDGTGDNSRKRKHEGLTHESRTSPVSPGAQPFSFGDATASPVTAPQNTYVPPPPPNAMHAASSAHASSSSNSGSAGPLPPIDTTTLPLPTESDKLTRCLFGEYYSHAASILDLSGRAAIYFVFSDLSVKLEGLFRPRYRFFDLFSRCDWSADVPVLAECWGGVFAVYSTKEFPGLKASSELTKHLNRWGIRVNIRETERKRRAPGGNGGNGGGRKTSEDADEDDSATVTGAPTGASSGAAGGSGSGNQNQMMDAPRRFLETAANSQRQRAERAKGKASEKSKKGGWRRGKTGSSASSSLPPPASASTSGASTSANTLPPMQGYEPSAAVGEERGKR